MSKISVVVSYCSLDKRFIKPLLNQLLIFCDDIVVVYFDKLLNGVPEPLAEIHEFLDIDRNKIRGLKLKHSNDHSSRYFHNLARWEGQKIAKYDELLFLDADEIPDGKVFKELLANGQLKSLDAADFCCYWYFRSAKYRATQTENCGLFIKRKFIVEKLMFTELERWSYRNLSNLRYGPLLQLNTGPFVHHFSWVRTEEEMLRKVSSWGHRHDRDWNQQIKEEFSRDFNGTDFVHGYSYSLVEDTLLIGM